MPSDLPVPSIIGVYEFSRQLSPLIAATAAGRPPVLITRRDRPVALLVSVALGLPESAAAGPPASVGVAGLQRELSRVLRTVEKRRQAVVVTRHRRPLAMLVPARGPLMADFWRAHEDGAARWRLDRRALKDELDEIFRHFRATSTRWKIDAHPGRLGADPR